MAKRKQQQGITAPNGSFRKYFKRTIDMSDQEYSRILNDARNPSIGYWIAMISVTLATLTLGIVILRSTGLSLASIIPLIIGTVLLFLILVRITRNIKERL
jgi:hypothetical protein